MNYIDKMIKNCLLAKAATPERTFILNEMAELNNVKHAIYIIEEVDANIESTRNAFINYKKSSERKCSKINENGSDVLYVGSSTTGVKKRFAQLLGVGHKATYALHLNHWFGPRKMKITVHEYDVPREILQIIEDSISYDLSPAFGKSGGNGK